MSIEIGNLPSINSIIGRSRMGGRRVYARQFTEEEFEDSELTLEQLTTMGVHNLRHTLTDTTLLMYRDAYKRRVDIKRKSKKKGTEGKIFSYLLPNEAEFVSDLEKQLQEVAEKMNAEVAYLPKKLPHKHDF